MKIAIASDHAGFEYKNEIIKYLKNKGHQVQDFGTDSNKAADYPDFVKPASISVSKGECDGGIVLGGSGNGEAIAANKVKGIRCAVTWNIESARLAKEHNDANVISIGQRMVSLDTALKIIDTWISSKFEAGRHIQRIKKIEKEY
jgi:ribose 5-phosphate isomerase B